MKNVDGIFTRLKRSRFRSGFSLRGKELDYLKDKGMGTVMEHARDFVDERLAPAEIPNDGKQTPMRNHPVFIAQHATATCCRKCLAKWHGISGAGHALTDREKEYVLTVIEKWLGAYQ
jgi:hypothetical protein